MVHLLNNEFDAISHAKEKWILIEATKIENNLSLTVTDSGLGIAADIQDQLVQPFFTTKKAQEKAGLGLTQVKKIIESYQGNLSLDTTCDQTKFKITMPIAQTKSKQTS